MNKPTIILLLILILFGCKKEIKSIDIANELRGNTFNMISISEEDTLTIEFKDSIYSVFDYNDRNLPWRIATFDNTQFLVFEKRIIALKQSDDNSFDGLLIGEKDYEIKFDLRKPKWNKDLLLGKWVTKERNNFYNNDSIQKSQFGLIPQPVRPPNFSNKVFQKQSIYELTLDSIYVKYGYKQSKSIIDLNSSFEFLSMNVKSNDRITEQLWKIKILTDSIIIVDKIIMEKSFDNVGFNTMNIGNIELIKTN